MVIERLEIKNFRVLQDVVVDCAELMAIIGRNGSGKSTVLRALDVFYNVSYQASAPFDYFAHDTSQTIEIRVTYGQLREDEVEEFKSFLTANKLIVSKKINAGGARYYGASRQIPQFADLRKVPGARDRRQKFAELVERAELADLIGKPSSVDALDELMLAYEREHQDLVRIVEKEEQFFGSRNIGGGKLDKYTKFVFIPAVRDAAAELEKRGAILQLIDVLVARNVNNRQDVKALHAEFETRVKEVYSGDNLTELGALATQITALLTQYAPGAELDLDFSEVIPPKIAFPNALASLVEDNFKCPISYSGHGLQRALIFALLQQLAVTDSSSLPEPEAIESAGVAGTGEPTPAVPSPSLILAIEEPELYLHPSRSRFLANVLRKLAEPPECPDDPRIQVLYGTHSPYFIQLPHFDRVRLTRKVLSADLDDPMKCQITAYSRQEAADRLAQVLGRSESEFTAESFVAHATPVMNAIVNEGFFADTVIVVEGLGELGALWALQEVLNKNWEAQNIVVVPASGKNNIDRPTIIFRGLSIQTFFLFDGDCSKTGKDKEGAIVSNRRLMTLAGSSPQDWPGTYVGEHWASFEDNFESEVKRCTGELFGPSQKTVCDALGISADRLLKNSESAALMVRTIYGAGGRIEVLEKVVESVSTMRQKAFGRTQADAVALTSNAAN